MYKNIYRIQNNDNLGPYRNKNKRLCNIVKNSTLDCFVPMYRGFLKERLKCDYKEIVYGFDSIESIFHWFDKETLELLHKENFFLSKCIIPNQLCDKHNDGQVIFRLKDCKIIINCPLFMTDTILK